MLSSLAAAEAATSFERARPLLGTFVSVRADGAGERAAMALDAAFEEVAEVQRTMSFHDPDSELSRLNRYAHEEPQWISHSLHRVLRASLALARASEGRFDPTVAWRLVAWGQLPAPMAAREPDPHANWRDVCFLRDGRVQYRRPLWLDLGGIAKGYAVDRAVRALQRRGVASGAVNAGGDLRMFGRMETVRVRAPADPRRHIPILHVRDAAVATSAGYFSRKNGRTALVDALRGDSLGQAYSVTVCARRATWADALTKVVLAAPDRATAVLRRLHASAVLIHHDGSHRRVA